jgi:GntR family transcriptional repressor for pyruvate dehydrogenase complex
MRIGLKVDNGIFKKIQTQKKSTVVVDQLIQLINENKLKVGDRLPSERDLSESLGVSRGVLRESLRALEIAGIIEAKSGSGNYIKSNANITREIEALNILEEEDNPLDIIMVRKNLEPLAVKLAVRNAEKEDITRMEKILKKMKNNKEKGIIDNKIDGQFHVAITEASKNRTLLDIMRLIVLKMQKQKFWQYTKEKSIYSLGHSGLYLDEHTQLVEAIKNKNKKRALEAINQHLKDVEKDNKEYFG